MGVGRQCGRGTIGCLFGLAILVFAVVTGIRVIPVKTKVMELKRFAEMQAEQASLPQHSDGYIVDQIFNKARALRLPLNKENIRVRRDMGTCYVDYNFNVTLDIPLYKYNWQVVEHIERPLF
ncbi:MAG: hypothetical protein NZ869_01295 [Thermoanaerobaculum sp.]|nr:hypothetical protein [Thermoanaerobaculum sp.]MCX7894378.1 hypothetical protein [Thermoanaerobaculum sp.]MDW7968104.1 hypothetical protein [Thermoanaerobaculum sp.]